MTLKPPRRVKVPEHANPLVRQLFTIMDRERIGTADMAERSGVPDATIKNWRDRANPILHNLEACLNVVGYELTIKRKPE